MVWFQCEDCGDNLKKPKLPNYFRICSATKLSCIDCGEMFGKESVQSHNQCLTEAENYGPKNQGKPSNGATSKSNKQQPDVDINVGLSERPPWFCCLCNTKATSKQTLLLHADGKKHRAKARAFHAKQQQDKQTEESVKDKSAANGNIANGELLDSKHVDEKEIKDTAKDDRKHVNNSEMETVKFQSKKKRKIEESESDCLVPKNGVDGTNESDNGVIQSDKTKMEELQSQLKKAKRNGVNDDKTVESCSRKEDTNKKIKLKKLIKSALRTNQDGALKMKKLKKLVLKSLQESGITKDEAQLSDMIEQKFNSSSRFRVDDKYVRLVVKD